MFYRELRTLNNMYPVTLAALLSLNLIQAKTNIYVTDDSPIERIGHRLYKRELLTDQYDDPKELAYDSASGNLFFMHMDDELQNSGRAFVNIATKNSMKIKGIARNKATAVDEDAGEVYFGSDDGLYRYNRTENLAVNVGLYNVNILQLVIRNSAMYVVDANDHMIYKVNENMRTARVSDMTAVMELNVDSQRRLHFVTMCGVFCDTGERVVKNADLNVVYHFIVDDNRVLGVTYDGLYRIDCVNGSAARVASLDFFPRSIIFGDYGDIFYSIDNNIYRLRPISSSYLVYDIYMKKDTIQ